MSLNALQTHLWTVHRAGREATAYVRSFSVGRELRVLVSGDAVFSRLLPSDDGHRRLALSTDTQSGGRMSRETGFRGPATTLMTSR